MSETAGQAAAMAEERRGAPAGPASPERTPLPWGVLATLITGIGGLATGSALAAMLSWSATPEVVAIEPVATADVDAAASSLFGPTMVATVEAARSCRRPLAFVTVLPAGDTVGMLRFRSGDYVSPNIKFGRNPFRLALPLPAPVSAGAGQIIVASDTGGAVVFLRPGVVIPLGTREMTIHVTWDPKMPCPAAAQ